MLKKTTIFLLVFMVFTIAHANENSFLPGKTHEVKVQHIDKVDVVVSDKASIHMEFSMDKSGLYITVEVMPINEDRIVILTRKVEDFESFGEYMKMIINPNLPDTKTE